MMVQITGSTFGAMPPAGTPAKEPETLKVTASMIDDMKTVVVTFMASQAVLAFGVVLWVAFMPSATLKAAGPLAVFFYSVAVLWICASVWKTFKTKLAVLNC